MALLGPDVSEPTCCFEQPVVVGSAARAALKMDRGTGVNTSRVAPREFQLDVPLEDLRASGAPRIPVSRAQKLIQVTKIGHHRSFP